MPYVPPGQVTGGVPHVPETSEKHFRWITTMNRDKFRGWLNRFGSRPGYGIVQGRTVDETKEWANKAADNGAQINASFVDEATNRVMWGEMVLVSLPQEEHQRRREEIIADDASVAASMYDQRVDELNENAPRGIRAFTAQKGEIDERKQFATRENNPTVAVPSNYQSSGGRN